MSLLEGKVIIVTGAGAGVGKGIALEAANYLFLAKRQKIRHLSAELDEARSNGRQLEKQIREAARV